VEFAHESDAQNAILLFNGYDLSGRKIEAKYAIINEYVIFSLFDILLFLFS
jgi:hypothetical protein